MRTFVTALFASALLMPGLQAAKKPADEGARLLFYVGTYTRDNSKGIYAYRFHPADGKLTPLGVAAETSNPSFLAVHPNGRFVYSVSEADGDKDGSVSAFRDRAGKRQADVAEYGVVEGRRALPRSWWTRPERICWWRITDRAA